MRFVDSANFQQFISAKRAAAVHFDAEWDSRMRAATRLKMREAQRMFGQTVNFGEVDCDKELALAKSLPVWNVPLVAYYRDGQLVAALIGAGQNVRARVERVLRNEPIGRDDGTSAAVPAPPTDT